MAELTATVTVTITEGGQQRELDWGGLVDGRPQTELGRDRRPVSCVEHGPLRRYFLARSTAQMAAVDTIQGPVQCDSELRPRLCIKLSVEGTRESSRMANTPY
jgi:hypothetical protein